MKLRIKGNSLRYRLTKSDMAQLATEGFIQETVEFFDNILTYVLQVASTQKLAADFKENVVTVYMPRTMMSQLAETEQTRFESKNGKLNILVEKDFVSLNNLVEDQNYALARS